MADPKWLMIGRDEMGVTEKSGKAANDRIIEYFAAAGHDEVKSDETAWCAAFANFCLETAGIRGTMSLAARSFLRWGKDAGKKPPNGAILVFKRGTSAWQGHVTFKVGETPTHFMCLGGNQGNKVKISNYPKKDLLGARWPVTVGNSRTVKAQVAGLISTGATAYGVYQEQKTTAEVVKDAAEGVQPAAEQISSIWPTLTWVFVACVVVAAIATIFIKRQDIGTKG